MENRHKKHLHIKALSLFDMNSFTRGILLFTTALFLFAGSTAAQNKFNSEADLLKQANLYFEEEEFLKAYPLFSQLLAMHQESPEYNYKFGVCMLFSVAEKEQAIKYLEIASKYPDVEPEVWYYLGRAYHVNYRFNDAITAYNKYKQVASQKKAEKLQVDRQIEMCNNGKKLLKNLSELVVLDKKELARSEFFRSYDLSEFNAKLIVEPDEFKTDLDKKKKGTHIMYLDQTKDEIYFSSYGKDGKNGKDIYVKRKLPNGEYGKPIALGFPVNTPYDEDFPFLHPSGKILYFCSKGHNSMGGYDVFKSERNDATGTWSKPVNMDFAINTPDDDFLFISDANDKIGYFASTRESSGDMVTVYKIKIERKPADIAIITGKVKREDGGTALSAKITVKDMYSDQVVGVYNSTEKTGSYLINLPNGGKFVFLVEAPGYKPYSESIQIPVQYELKPIGQEIILKKEENGQEIVKIVNKFDGSVSDEDYLTAMQFIKEKSKLDVNTSEQNTSIETALNDTADETNTNTETEIKTDFSNDDLVKIAYDGAKDAQKEANDIRKDADESLVIASQKNDEAQQKKKELDDAVQNNADKQKIDELKKEDEKLTQETITAFNLADKLDADAKKKQEQADFEMKYAKDLERAMQSSSNTETVKKLNQQKDALDKMNQQNQVTSSDDYSTSLTKLAEQKQKEAENAKKKSEDAKQEIVQLQEEADRLQKEADQQKNPELKQSLLDQVNETKTELVEKQNEANAADTKSKKLQAEANKLKIQADYSEQLVSDLKDNKVNTSNVSSIDKQKLQEQVSSYQSKTIEPEIIADNTTKTETNQPTVTEQKQTYQEIYAQQLKDADNLTDPVQKEQKKSEIYANWSADAKKELDVLKSSLKDLKTKEEKDEAKKKIIYLDAVVSEKNQQSELSADNAKKIKEQQSFASNQQNQPDNKEPVLVVTKEDVKKVNDTYADKLKDAEKLPEGFEKEKKKQEIYTQWSGELKQKERELQEQLDTTKSLNGKIAVQDAINQVSVQTKEKEKLADASSKEAEKIKEQNTIASNPVVNETNTTNDQPLANVVVTDKKNFTEQIEEAGKIKEPYRQDSLRSEIYNEWVKDIKNERDSLSGVWVKTKNKKEKETLKTKIDDLDKQIEKTQTLANESFSNYIKAKETAPVTTQPTMSDNELAFNTASEKNKTQFTANDNELQSLSEKKYDGDPTRIEQAQLLQDEAAILFQGAESEKEKSKTLTGSEKETSMKKAQDMELQAIAKQNEAKKIYASLKVVTVAENTTATNTQQPDNTQITTNKPENKTENTNTETNSQPTTNIVISSTAEYKQYETIQQESDNLKTSANTDYKKANELKMLSDDQSKKSQELIESTANINDPVKQKEILKQAEELDKASLKNLHDADSIKAVAQKTEAYAATKQKQADDYLATLDKSKSDEIASAYKADNPEVKITEPLALNETNTGTNPEIKTQPETKTEPVVKTENKMPEIIMVNTPIDKIEVKDQPVYSVKKPIPVDVKLPEGLIFKVQIGAFKNPIPQNTFKGISPIAAETTPYGYTRYTAGVFTSPDKALNARDQIRGMGYKDAFVVAFYNGKRISYEQAMEMMKNGGQSPMVDNNMLVKNDQPVKTVTKTEPENKTTVTENKQPVTTQTQNQNTTQPVVTQINDVKSTDVKSVNGLFFTVQVGVYSKKVTSAQLYNVSPLNSEMLPNGLIRYTSGTYKDVAAATKAKDAIVNKGIKDAFVTAYYNGQRITVEEAAKIIAEKGSSVLTGDAQQTPPDNKTPDTKTPDTNPPVVKVDTTKPFVPVPNTAFANDTGIVYKVQIGAYKDQVPIGIANQFVKIAEQGISTAKQDNGITLLTVGSFKTYKEAEKARNAIAEQGIDAFVIATRMNKKIFIQENLDDDN